MTKEFAEKFVAKELRQLGYVPTDWEIEPIYKQAVEAADILTKERLTQLIEDLLTERGL